MRCLHAGIINAGSVYESLKSCVKCKKDTQHIGLNNFLQPPQYLIIVVSRFENKCGTITKNKALLQLDRRIASGPFDFRLQAMVDHHGHSTGSGHYTASVICCSEVFYCNDSRVTVYSERNIRDSHAVYIVVYKLLVSV